MRGGYSSCIRKLAALKLWKPHCLTNYKIS